MNDKEYDTIQNQPVNSPESGKGRPALNELKRLEAMLTDANIPYNRHGRSQICYYGSWGRAMQLGIPIYFGNRRVGPVCSVICRPGSYGFEEGLLEISGLMTDEERSQTEDSVLGHLTAENVFARIQAHYTRSKQVQSAGRESNDHQI